MFQKTMMLLKKECLENFEGFASMAYNTLIYYVLIR